MKKLFSILLVTLLVAGSAYGMNETHQAGSQNITSCYMIGVGPCTSGNVVVLQTNSPTYWGGEVTGTITQGMKIHGVVVDTTNYTSEQMAAGRWVRVQTYGYCPIVKLGYQSGAVTASTSTGTPTAQTLLVTSSSRWGAISCNESQNIYSSGNAGITGNSVALETKKSGEGEGTTIKAFLGF